MKAKTYHVYALDASDGTLHHYRVNAHNTFEAGHLFTNAVQTSDMEHFVLEKPIGEMKEHMKIIRRKKG